MVDLPAVVQSNAAMDSTTSTLTFKDFISTVLNSIASAARNAGASRIDIVADQYYKLSIN